MDKTTDLHINAALAGFADTAQKIREALGNESHEAGRLPSTLRRVGEIAAGGEIADMKAAQADLLYSFDFLRYLRGGFYEGLQGVLFKAHERCAEWVSKKQADEILGKWWVLLESDIGAGLVHPRVHYEKEPPRIWDGAWSGGKIAHFYRVEYATYELNAARKRRDDNAAIMAQWKATQAAQEGSK